MYLLKMCRSRKLQLQLETLVVGWNAMFIHNEGKTKKSEILCLKRIVVISSYHHQSETRDSHKPRKWEVTSHYGCTF